MDLAVRGPIQIVLMDQEGLFLDALSAKLIAEQEIEVVLADSDPQKLLETCLRSHPEVAVFNLNRGGGEAFNVASEIHARQRTTRFLFLAHQHSDLSIEHALRIGGFGFLLHRETYQTLIDSIKRINRGDFCFSESIEQRLTYNRERHSWSLNQTEGVASLTNRQMEVLRHLATGRSVKEVAKRMHLSEKSVDSHKYRIMNKLQIHDRVELARFAIREGLAEA